MTSFDLRRTKLRPGEQFRTVVPVRLEPLAFGGERYAPVPVSPDATLTITRTAQGYVFELALEAALEGPCMRCLSEARVDVPIRGREYHEQGADTEELTTPYLEDGRLDLSAWARDTLSLALPEQVLCREECAGLCAGCGANLNEEPCSCGPVEPDRRWSKLAELKERLGS
jgi:uncharacterized protein